MTAQSEAPSLPNVEDVGIDEDTSVLSNDTVIVHKSKGSGRKKAVPTTKATRGRAKKGAVADDVNSSMLPDGSTLSVQPTRTTRRNASRTVSAQVDSSMVDQTLTSTRPHTTRGKGKGKQRVTDDGSQSSLDFDAAINSTILSGVENTSPVNKGTKRTSDGVAKTVSKGKTLTTENNVKPNAKTAKSTKRTSDGVPKNSVQTMVHKLDSSIIIFDEAPIGSDDQQGRAKRPRRVPNKAGPKLKQPSNAGVVPRKASTTKGKKGKQPVRQPLAEIILDGMVSDMEGDAVHRSLPEPPQRVTPELSQDDVSPAPSTPTPARPRISVPRTRKTFTPSASTLRKVVATPSVDGSPQSSNAENRPPQSGAMDYMSLFSPLRVPLASTPKSSPSRRNIASRLNTTLPWSAVNLESVFLGFSPSKTHDSGNENSENSASIDPNLNMGNLDKKGLAEVVKAVKSNLKPEERKMTVEEWVRWNAKVAEEKLRTECEAMVSKFESEGGRAMRALEGVVCDK